MIRCPLCDTIIIVKWDAPTLGRGICSNCGGYYLIEIKEIESGSTKSNPKRDLPIRDR